MTERPKSSAGQAPDKFYSIDDVAELLGVCPRTVRRAIDDELLIAHYFGRLVRISKGDLAAYLAARRGP